MKTKSLIVVWGSVFLMAVSSVVFAAVPDKEFEIGMTKGAYAIDNGSYAEAQTYLQKALDINNSDPQALLLMGIALSREEKYSEAKGYLINALQQDPDSWRAKFEQGIVQYHLGSWDEAGGLFEEVRKSDADKHAKSVARKYLSRMKGKDEKPYRLELYTGWQYDDNVILEEENPLSWDDEDETDWRWLVLFDGSLTLFQNNLLKAEAGYTFYHSFHDSLDEFDVEQHHASFSGAIDPDGPLMVELKYKFSSSEVDGRDYSTFNTVGTIFSYTHSPENQTKFRTEIHYDHEFQDYEWNRIGSIGSDETIASYFNSARSGGNDVAGITQKILFNENHILSLDYTYNRKSVDSKDGENYNGWMWLWDNDDNEFWGYDGHRGGIQLTSNISRWQLFLSASYCDRKYEEGYWPDVWPDTYRHDKTQEYAAAITWNPYNWLSISFTENYSINKSNIEEADYKRNIIGLVVGVGI